MENHKFGEYTFFHSPEFGINITVIIEAYSSREAEEKLDKAVKNSDDYKLTGIKH